MRLLFVYIYIVSDILVDVNRFFGFYVKTFAPFVLETIRIRKAFALIADRGQSVGFCQRLWQEGCKNRSFFFSPDVLY